MTSFSYLYSLDLNITVIFSDIPEDMGPFLLTLTENDDD